MRLDDIDTKPELASTLVTLRSGEPATLRPLCKDDGQLLGAYFMGLSEVTTQLYAPHPFDQATADSLCAELDSIVNLRMLAIAEREGGARVIAYFIVHFGVGEPDMKRYAAVDIELDTTTDCELAPSVADDDQSTGVGSLVMGHLVPLLRAAGRKRLLLMGGVKTENVRAIHFYEKFGFRAVGKFAIQGRPCIDMIADL